MKYLKRFLLNLLIILDELGNTLTLGSPEETISSRAAKARNAGKRWGCVLCRFLDWIQPHHCDNALEDQAAGVDAVIPDDDTNRATHKTGVPGKHLNPAQWRG